MRAVIFYIIFTSISFHVWSQDNLQMQFSYRGSVAGARFLPSTQIMEGQKFEASFLYSNWVANKSLTYSSIRKIYKQNELTREDVSNIIDELDTENKFGAGQDFMVIGVGLSTTIKEHPVTWSFTIYDRLNVNAFIPKNLVQVVWQGNKQFRGQTLDHSNTRVVGLYFREYSLGFAMPILEWSDWKVRGGFRFSYYQGLSGLTNPRSKFLSTTAVDAEYIDMDFDFEYLYAGIDDFQFLSPKGHGVGANFGTTFSFKEFLTFDIGVTDIGSIKFKKEVYKVSSKDVVHFTGLGLGDVINTTAFIDSVAQIFTPTFDSLEQNEFKMPIGAKLSFMTSWTFGKKEGIPQANKMFFSYIQGFAENPGVTLTPKFTLAYHRQLFEHFNIGLSTSVGGFNNFGIGGLIGLQYEHFRFSIQSDDLTGFIAPENTTGAGVGIVFQMLF